MNIYNSVMLYNTILTHSLFFFLVLFFRLLVVRLHSPLSPRPCPSLASLAGELEESARLHAVTVVVLQRRPEDPQALLVAALPSGRHLSWELSKLQAQGYGGLAEASAAEVFMREGEQLVVTFTGNITSNTGREVETTWGERERNNGRERDRQRERYRGREREQTVK